MNLDSLTQLSNAQVVTGNTNSTNAYDVAATQGFATGIGEPMECVIMVAAATMNGQACTCTLYADDDNNGTNKVTVGSVIIPSTVAAGGKFVIDIPAADDFTDNTQSRTTSRYYYLTYTFSGTSITLNAYLMPDDMIQNDHAYPKSGYTVK